MADRCPGGGAGQGGPAGVAEQVQHPQILAAALPQLLRHPDPVGRLLREKPRMLEARGPHAERKRTIADHPAFGKAAHEFPMPAAGGGAHIICIHIGCIPRHGPNGLRVGPKQRYAAPALELVASAGIEHGKVFPTIGKVHRILLCIKLHVPGVIRPASCSAGSLNGRKSVRKRIH